jgi:hypothetical protein
MTRNGMYRSTIALCKKKRKGGGHSVKKAWPPGRSGIFKFGSRKADDNIEAVWEIFEAGCLLAPIE